LLNQRFKEAALKHAALMRLIRGKRAAVITETRVQTRIAPK
jgi:hypothetical protein